MTASGPVGRRLLAFVLLTVVSLGPAGLAGLLHPFDDAACAPPPVGQTAAGSWGASPDHAGDPHCLTCHLLRSVRWGVAVEVKSGYAPHTQVALHAAGAGNGAGGTCLKTTGRSPPRLV